MILAVIVTSGCASRQATGPREYLDERTAATITVAGETMVFAYDRPELGVNARDYVTLTAVDVNTSGRHALHLVGYAWSTLDKRGVAEGDSRYEIMADDRTLPLQPMPDGFRSIGVNEPPIPVPSRSSTAAHGTDHPRPAAVSAGHAGRPRGPNTRRASWSGSISGAAPAIEHLPGALTGQRLVIS